MNTSLHSGGMVILNNQLTSQDILDNIISLTPFGAKSIGGYLFKGKLDVEYTSLYGGLPNIFYNTTEVLIKILQISNPNEFDTSFNNKEIVSEDEFNDEVIMQKLVFYSSLTRYLEPICPNILYSDINYDIQFVNCANSNLIHDILSINRTQRGSHSRFGIIIMELLPYCQPISELFPSINSIRPVEPISSLTDAQRNALDNYTFQLLRLFKLNIIHGDTHLDNALIISNYNYIGGIRVFLIDFGRSFQINFLNLEHASIDDVIQNKDWWSYRMIATFIMDKLSKPNATFKSIHDHYLQEVSLSEDVFINKLYENRIIEDLYNATNSWLNINDKTKIMDEFNDLLLFYQYNMFCMDINMDIPALNINMANDKCNGISRYTFQQSYYDVDDAIQLYHNDETDTYIHAYINEQLQYTENKPQIFLWMIGIEHGMDFPNIYTIQSESCYEIGIKHYLMHQTAFIEKFFAAGEMLINGTTVNVNFESGTFTVPLFEYIQRSGINMNEYTRNFNEVIMRFMNYKINKGKSSDTKYTFRLSNTHRTFFTENYCCDERVRQNEKTFMKYVAKNINGILDPSMVGGEKNNTLQMQLDEHAKQDYELFKKYGSKSAIYPIKDKYFYLEKLIPLYNDQKNKTLEKALCIIHSYVKLVKTSVQLTATHTTIPTYISSQWKKSPKKTNYSAITNKESIIQPSATHFATHLVIPANSGGSKRRHCRIRRFTRRRIKRPRNNKRPRKGSRRHKKRYTQHKKK
jgi:hypothetical protein